MNRIISGLVFGVSMASVLTGCAAPLVTGAAFLAAPAVVSANNKPTDITDKYTDAQVERCARSLTHKDQLRAQEAMKRKGYIPLVGPMMMEKAYYAEAEKICKEKGII